MSIHRASGAWFGDPDDPKGWVPLGVLLCERPDCGEPATTLLIAGGKQFHLCAGCARRQVTLRQIRRAGLAGMN